MREILFRGKTDKGEWVQGQLLHFKASVGTGELAIIVEGCEWDNSNEWFNLGKRAKVIPETIGQYTGLTDKNGTKIFEGDICTFVDFHSGCDIEQYCEGVWEYEDCCFYITERLSCDTTDLFFEGKFDGYVIGNIHDNPELLKEREG